MNIIHKYISNLKIKNTKSNGIKTISLGQSGFCFQGEISVIYIDPYLSDSVEKYQGEVYKRQKPIWKNPQFVNNANWVLITHNHIDHCDLETLIPISIASPSCSFIGPKNVCDLLIHHGIASNRVVLAPIEWLDLNSELRIHAIPAAHPEIRVDADGNWQCVGYIIEIKGKRIYHAGDTSLAESMIEYVKQFIPIDTAFLPFNEMNYYRNECGIIGNMGIRDAFNFAQILGVNKVVPMHWDMFLPNSVFREEIELYYKLVTPPFELMINPSFI